MNWRDEWCAIGGRIEGLISSGSFFVQILRVNSNDAYGVGTHLIEQALEIYSEIKKYYDRNNSLLPQSAERALFSFIGKIGPKFSGNPLNGLDGMKFYLTSLSWLKAEFEYFIADFSFQARKRSERAFIHLQQSIVADKNIRDQWQQAFKNGELHCERLGGAHLLLHGIWAFKVTGLGASTDLVFGEPVERTSESIASADALVLTEWKKVESEFAKIAESARKQADLYSAGVLGGLELREYRYIVL
ncbi:MAG: hypothetical protein C0399_12700, partial [Syntrophus sp. (in: bacteria)]|nr:hypothetical protein [Syntrophus sp. (in: bacteria)]